MKNRILLQTLLVILIMFIGIFSSIPNVNAASQASLSSSAVTQDDKGYYVFTITLNLPSNAKGGEADISVKYSNGSTATGRIAYIPGLSSNSVEFKTTVTGNATVTASNIKLSDANAVIFEQGGSTSITVNIVKKEEPQTPATPTNPTPSTPSTPSNPSTPSSGGNSSSNDVKFTDVNETVYTNEKVNIRKSYSTSSDRITTVNKDTKLTRTGIGNNGWSRVNYNGQTGYIYSQYLTTSAPANETEEKPEEPEQVTFTDKKETVYATQDCNVRESWSTSSNKVGYLKVGQEITRTGVADNGWSRINYEGKTAYVASRLLSTQKPEETDENETTDENLVENEVVENQVVEGETTELQNLQETIGVLPEVGNNIATRIYFVITIIAISLLFVGIYYINNKKDVK